MAGAFETVYDSVRDAAGAFLKNPTPMALEFAKVAALGLCLQVVFIFMMIGLGAASNAAGSADIVMVATVVAMALLAIAFFILTTAVSATPYCILDALMRGERIGIISKIRQILPAIAGFCAIIIGLFLLAFGFALGIGLLSGGNEYLSTFLMLAALIGIIAAVFYFQFAVPKIALDGADAVGALKASYGIVNGNTWAVLLFDIILLICVFGSILVLSMPQMAVESQMYAAGTDTVMAFFLFAAYVLFSMVEMVIVSLITVNLWFFFLRRLEGTAAPAQAVPEKPQSRKRSARR